jgi:hypothetical protein
MRSAGFNFDRSPALHGSTWMTLPPCSICTLECMSGVISIFPPVAGYVSAAMSGAAAMRSATAMRTIMILSST